MERRTITQLLNKAGVTLEEDGQKELVDSLLDVFHEELDSQRDLAQASSDKAKELSSSLNELQKKYDQSIRNSEDLDALKSEIQALKNEHKQELQKIEANYNQKLLNSAIETALTKAGARNNKAVAALIDTTNLKLNDDGSVFGLAESIESVKEDESTSFLFEDKTEKPVHNYIPQGDVEAPQKDPIDAIFNSTMREHSQKISGWE